MKLNEIKSALISISEEAGPEGMELAHALIRAYAGIGRGIDGVGCIIYLVDLVLKGRIRYEGGKDHNYWVYEDSDGIRRVGGGAGDKVLPTIAKIGNLFHNHAGNSSLDEQDILHRLLDTPNKVAREIESRKNLAT